MRPLSIFFFSLFLSVPVLFSQRIQQPDFAFPKTVIKESLSTLDSSLKAGDNDKALRALINYTISELQLGEKSLSSIISRIDSVGTSSPDPILRSLTSLLKATIYNDRYSSSKWLYDKRELPITPLSEDCSEWSGAQFRLVINELLDSALNPADLLKKERLAKYPLSITQDAKTRIYFPTIYDFVAMSSINILKSLESNSYPIFPYSFLENISNSSMPTISGDKYNTKIIDLYTSFISPVAPYSAPSVNAQLGCLRYIAAHTLDPRTGSRLGDSDVYMRLYNKLCDKDGRPGSEYVGDVLIEAPHNDGSYDTIKSFLSFYPGYWRANCLKNILTSLLEKSVEVTGPSLVPINKDVEIKVVLKNTSSVTLSVYDVSTQPLYEQEVRVNSRKDMPGKKVSTIPVKAGFSKLPDSEEMTIKYRFPYIGNFIIIPEIDGVPLRSDTFTKIHASSVVIVPSRFDRSSIWAMDASNGKPLENVKMTLYSDTYSRNVKSKNVGVTDKDGFADLGKIGNGQILASLGKDRFTSPVYYYDYSYTRPDKWLPGVTGFSSLPVYHPGDTVQWVGVCYEYKGGLRRVAAGKLVDAVLYDATSSPIDTITGVTDKFGRLSGQFSLPTDVLTGRYSINVDGQWGVISFEVADYRLPSFQIILDPVEKGTPGNGDVTIHGLVKTYSGFPVRDSEVSMNVTVTSAPVWWRRAASIPFYSDKISTDSEGRFSFVITKEEFESSPLAKGFYTCDITVLSQTGESQTSKISFTPGTRYVIKATLPGNIDIASGRTRLDVKITDSNDSTVNEPVILTIFKGKDKIRSGILSATENLSGLKPGKYNFVFSLPDPTLADSISVETILYNPSDSVSPVPQTLFWSPDPTLYAGKDGEVSVLYATGADSHLLLAITSRDSLLSTQWVNAPTGMRKYTFSLPDDIEEAQLNVLCTGDYRQMSQNFTIKRKQSVKGLRIIKETFRDKLIPGSSETWTFRITTTDGNGVEAAAIADLYNTALDAIATSDWNFNLSSSYAPRWMWTSLPLDRTFFSSRYVNGKYLRCPSLEDATFNTFGHSFMSDRRFGHLGNIKIRGAAPMMMKAAATDMASSDEVIEETAEFEMATNESAVEADAGAGGLEEGKISEDSNDINSIPTQDYRIGEIPLAFFRPLLVSEPDGSLTLSFTVPNANTKWGFRALAFTESLISATLSEDIVASKPIMVDPNLPRFLRVGDQAVLKASIMNSSDRDRTVNTKIEIFNPVDSSIILVTTQSDSLQANSSCVASVTVQVPSGIDLIGYRIRSSDEEASDGEQQIIPVLPNVTQLIETTPFFIGPDENTYKSRIPDPGKGGRVTLSFCENPSWFVVTALPSYVDDNPSTAPQAAMSLYSVAIASGLLRDNPAIAEAIRLWSESDRSSGTLTSMLEKNKELKDLLLNSTPWITDAQNDTERMSRLALYFDTKNIQSSIQKTIDVLYKLRSENGGWCWSSGFRQYSEWSTRQVLSLLGQLNSMGYLPKDRKLQSMIAEALRRDSKEMEKQFLKYPEGDYSSYILIHDLFAGFPEAKVSTKIVDTTTQRILKDWRSVSLPRKSIYARILFNNGFKNSAKEVLSSIRQFAVSDKSKGMWFPQLDNHWYGVLSKVGITADILRTFYLIEPGCPEIDQLRQWLIVQKGSQNWGDGVNAANVVSAILTTSGKWFVPAKGAIVSIGGKRIEADPTESLLGEITFSCPSDLFGKNLKIKRIGSIPSWGCVYSLRQAEIRDVDSHSCPELSIEKNIYESSDPQADNAKALSLGDKVSVTLTIKANTDMSYVTVMDERPACFEPVNQLSGMVYSDGIGFYMENRDSETRLFINSLPKGTYVLSYEMWVNNEGTYTSGVAKIQSQYAPQYSAHSSGTVLDVK